MSLALHDNSENVYTPINPRGHPGVKSTMYPPYPQRVVKGD